MRATDGHAFASDFKSWVRERSVQLGALALRRLVADARPSSTAQVLWISLHYEARPRAFTVREFVAMSVHEAQMLLGNTAPDLRAILEEPIHGARGWSQALVRHNRRVCGPRKPLAAHYPTIVGAWR